MLDSNDPYFDGGESFIQKMAVVIRWIIIHLEILLKGMAAQAHKIGSLMLQLNHSIKYMLILGHII